MKLQNLSTTLRAGALAALFVVGSSAAASAATVVSFSTDGQFAAGGSGGTVSPGGSSIYWEDADGDRARLSFVGAAGVVNAPTNINYGVMYLSLNEEEGEGGDGEWDGDISGTTFELTINQTAPSVGSSSFSSTLTGTIVQSNSTDFKLFFDGWPAADTFTSIGDVDYSIQSRYLLVPPGQGAIIGATTLQGEVTASAVPEPATMMLLGTGLLAAFRARRKSA